METKAMLPDSTQSDTIPPASSSSAPNPRSSKRDGSMGSNTKGKKSDASKMRKKRKSEDRTSKSSKRKKLGKEKTHKDQKSSKKSKKGNPAEKKAEEEEQDSDLDLENNLKPIRDYVKDREEMLGHMFKCVMKANKLQAMLPDILKDIQTEELQNLCLLQLEGMSKSRIMSILAGEEMQSSSEDEDEDSDLEKQLPKPDKAEDLINSEVVDSTSSLLQASQSTGDAEDALSVQEAEEEVAEEEADARDSNVENDAEFEEEEAGSVDGSWQDGSERQQRYSSEEEDADEDRQQDEDAEMDSLAEEDREELQEEVEEDEEETEETTVVRKPKKFRRIKIVRAEGEECEEGEITSDEVETDEESNPSNKEDNEELARQEDDTGEAQHPDTHPEAATDGATQGQREPSGGPDGNHPVTGESLLNSGNPGDEDDDDNDVDVDDDDASANVVSDMNVAEGVVDSSAVLSHSLNPASTGDSPSTSVAVDANVEKNIADDTLNVFAEDNLETDSEELGAPEAAKDVAKDSSEKVLVKDSDDDVIGDKDKNVVIDKNIDTVDDTINNNGNNDSDNDNNSDNEVDDDEEDVADDLDDDDDDDTDKLDSNQKDLNTCVDKKSENVKTLPDPPTQGQGVTGPAKAPGRKVTQELEVLELELRARAIRSLMKQYGKDVG